MPTGINHIASPNRSTRTEAGPRSWTNPRSAMGRSRGHQGEIGSHDIPLLVIVTGRVRLAGSLSFYLLSQRRS